MMIVLIVASIVFPLVMVYIQYRWRRLGTLFNILMVLSVIIFGDIVALSIYHIIKNNTVFMTTIHAVFLDPLFLVTSAYMGEYTIYRLLLLTIGEW